MPRTPKMVGLVAALALGLPQIAAAKPRVEMELATEPGFPITGAQKWVKLLGGLGLDGVRIRSRTAGDAPKNTQRGTDASPSYHVLGILTAGDRLQLEGATFTSRDVGRIQQYLEKLRSTGSAAPGAKPGPFGLSEDALAEVMKALAGPLDFGTKGTGPAKLVEKLATKLALPVATDPAAATRLAEADPLKDELRGLAAGTALAAMLRPSGLVLQPQKTADGVRLAIAVATPKSETWPVGFKPQKPERELLPVLFEFLNVEIEGIKLPAALEALSDRLEVPFLLDHNALALHGIDPAAIDVSVPSTRSYYKRILDRVLFQARLKCELRIDEADKPFIWITTIKP